jgi:hypothetical protein
MQTFLGILQAIVTLLSFVKEHLARTRGRAEGRQEVLREIANEQTELHRETAEAMADRSGDDGGAASQRLRDGSF